MRNFPPLEKETSLLNAAWPLWKNVDESHIPVTTAAHSTVENNLEQHSRLLALQSREEEGRRGCKVIHWQFSQQISSLHGSAGSVSVQRDDWQTLWCTISCVTAHSTTSRWEKTCSNVLSTGEFPDADLWVSFEGILLDCIYPQIENILPFFEVRVRITLTALGVPNFWAFPPSSPPASWDTWLSGNSMNTESGPDLQRDAFLKSVSLMPW